MPKIRTKPFSRLNAAAKRIAIAEDILKQIKADRYNIQTGTWLVVDVPEPVSSDNSPSQSQMVQAALLGGKHTVVVNAPPATCTCCAVGAAVASAIRLFNQDGLSGSIEEGYELDGYVEGVKILEKYFPRAQVDLMEAAFEQRSDGHHNDASERALEGAVEFGEMYDESTERLKAICQNIIKNKGTFKP